MDFIYSQLFVKPAYPKQSFAGQTTIVTGSNVGLGREAARHLARLGAAKVILAVRNLSAGEDARKDIIKSTKCNPDVIEVWSLDLCNHDSVKKFASRAERELKRIDVLLENAGLFTDKFELVDGHEKSVMVNVVSTFLLAFLLLPKLESTARDFGVKPRLTIVSSEVHGWTKFPEWKHDRAIFSSLDDENTPTMSERYPTTKLLEVLAVRQIAPSMKGSNVILNYLNPGFCHSELARDAGWMVWLMKLFLARTTEVGSRTLVASAAAGEESHGKYMYDSKVNDKKLSSFVRSSDGDIAAKRVWTELKEILETAQKGVTRDF